MADITKAAELVTAEPRTGLEEAERRASSKSGEGRSKWIDRLPECSQLAREAWNRLDFPSGSPFLDPNYQG